MTRLYLAIVHHPVVNRRGEVITATIDHFDVFDASRLSLTYPLRGLYVVNPEPSQEAVARRLIKHGTDPHRTEERDGCFDKTHWAPSLEATVAEIEAREGRRPVVVVTSAHAATDTTSFAGLRAALADGAPHLLVVGKASGLSADALADADMRLEPIDGGTDYRHLSVRSAMAILVDRLLRP